MIGLAMSFIADEVQVKMVQEINICQVVVFMYGDIHIYVPYYYHA